MLSHEQEEEIVLFVNGLRKQGVPVSTTMLTIRAKEVAAEAGINAFGASASWVIGFKRRHQMSIRTATRQGQTSPKDLEMIAAAFAVQVEELVRQLGLKRVYNADQTGYIYCLIYLIYILTNDNTMF